MSSLGLLNATSGKSDLALAEYQKALDINPNDAEAIMNIAAIYERLKHRPEAEANFQAGDRVAPRLLERLSLARALLRPAKIGTPSPSLN